MPRAKRARPLHGLYKHKRLRWKHNEIRLIRLKPAAAIREVAYCDIVTVPLEHAPRYEAISYAWGNTSDLWPVGVGSGQHILVSKSLESALRYLRHPDKERILWADAMCIDQHNLPERNRAVSKMHLIYQHADQVIVWLGCPSRPWSFKPLLDALEGGEHYDDNFYFSWRCQILTKPHKNARAIHGFASLPWFSRGWVVQEVCFARELTAQYGKYTIPWRQLEHMVERLPTTASSTLSGWLYPEGRLLLRLMRFMSTLRDLRNQHGKRSMDLGSLMSFSRMRKTSDPLDKIFAFVNLLSTVPVSLQPDYRRSASELFRDVFRLLFEEGIGLRLLAECEAGTGTGTGISHCRNPSWLPDWSYTRRCAPLFGGLSQSHLGESYCTGLNREASVVYSATSAILRVTGLLFDKIVLLDARGQYFIEDGTFTKNLWEKIRTMFQTAEPGTLLSSFISGNHKVFDEQIWRMEHFDRDPQGRKTNDLTKLIYGCREGNLQRADGRITLLTSRGHLGWAPPAADLEDTVAVIPGCHVPIIVRRVHATDFADANLVCSHDAKDCSQLGCEDNKSQFYRVLGEAYVQGIMNGEALAFSGDDNGNQKLEEIALV